MTQPAGRVFGVHDPATSFALRSSPIICVCDACHLLFCLVYHMLQMGSFRPALGKITTRRLCDPNLDPSSSLTQLQNNRAFRITVFTLGALPQIIKLFGIHGLKWTTMLGSMFLGPFLVLEILVVSVARGLGPGPSVTTGDPPPQDRYANDFEKFFAYFVGLGNVLLRFYVETVVIYRYVASLTRSIWPHYLSLAFLVTATAIHMMWSKNSKELPSAETVMVVPMNIVLALSLGLFVPLLEGARGTGSKPISWTYLVTTILYAIGLFGIISYWYVRLSRPRASRYAESGMHLWFMFHNILTALMYYALAYDPAGTVKPAWTNLFG